MRRLALVLAVLALPAFAAPEAMAEAQWWEGEIKRSYVTNCVSVIQGNPYQEEGAWNWGGFWADDANWPNPGEVFYMHVVVGAVGNSCSGQRTYPTFSLPSGVSPAISQQTPVVCWAINFEQNTASQEPAEPNGACPQQAYTDPAYGGTYSIPAVNQQQYGYTWPLPQGRAWEFWYPVVSNRELKGNLVSPCDCLRVFTKMLDGNSSPVLNPQAPLVNDPPSAPAGGGTTPGGTTGTKPTVTQNPAPSGGSGGGGGGGGTTTVPPPVFTSFSAPSSLSVGRLVRGGLSTSVLVGRAGSKIDAVLTGSPRGNTLSARRIVLAKATRRSAAAGKNTLRLRVTRAGKRALRRIRRGRARLTVTVTPPGGAKVSKSKRLRLRR